MRMNMKAERARTGLTAEEVAKRIGVSVNTLLRWESGQNVPLAENLMHLAQLYKCSPDYLLDIKNGETHSMCYSH